MAQVRHIIIIIIIVMIQATMTVTESRMAILLSESDEICEAVSRIQQSFLFDLCC